MFRVVIPARHASTRLPGKPLAAACRHAHGPSCSPARAPRWCSRGDRRDRRREDPGRLFRRRRRRRDDVGRARVRHRSHCRDCRPARLVGRRHRRECPGRRAAVAARAHRAGRQPAHRNGWRRDRNARGADRERGRLPRSECRQGRDARRRDGALLQSRADSLGPRRHGQGAGGRWSASRRSPAPRYLRVSRFGPARTFSRAPGCARAARAARAIAGTRNGTCDRRSRMRSKRQVLASIRRRTSRASRRSCAAGAARESARRTGSRPSTRSKSTALRTSASAAACRSFTWKSASRPQARPLPPSPRGTARSRNVRKATGRAGRLRSASTGITGKPAASHPGRRGSS